ncbi:phosphoribosylformylglycinamidine synthase I [Thalassoglobus sp. JC818]|uniref:phosphoribosylformylglycinamidine synthase I n=1 Tax=Thalassoglobus sp. JC818 TaxID=3232136 RepID=UPI003458ACBC
MASPRVCVLRAPGTNCDHETAHAFELAGGEAERVHLFRVLENPEVLKQYQILCIPGGFSYGDDVGAGVVFGTQLKTRLADTIQEFLQSDTLTLGICNGFQVLMKSGILPGGADQQSKDSNSEPEATLTWNESGRYTDLWVNLKSCSSRNVFLKGIDQLESPIAHAEGRLRVSDESVLQTWEENGQVALRYTTASGADSSESSANNVLPYPENPNGSFSNIAGLGDPSGRVLGLMPHPERFLFATQHPQWTRKNLRGDGAGLQIFKNAVEYF